jgi:hypothetical protein
MSEDVVHKVAAGGFTELQQALLGTESVEQFLQELALLAARLVANGLSCGMRYGLTAGPCRSPAATRWPRRLTRCSTGWTTGHACTPCGRGSWCASTTRRRGPLAAVRVEGGIARHRVLPGAALIADGKPVGAR